MLQLGTIRGWLLAKRFSRKRIHSFFYGALPQKRTRYNVSQIQPGAFSAVLKNGFLDKNQ